MDPKRHTDECRRRWETLIHEDDVLEMRLDLCDGRLNCEAERREEECEEEEVDGTMGETERSSCRYGRLGGARRNCQGA